VFILVSGIYYIAIFNIVCIERRESTDERSSGRSRNCDSFDNTGSAGNRISNLVED